MSKKTKRSLIIPIVVGLLLGLLSMFHLNSSSVGMFCFSVPIGCDGKDTLAFNNRPIRSDEWLVGTPLILAQSISGNKLHTDLIGHSAAIPLLSSTVTGHWTAFTKPYALGFLFLSPETAYSLMWLIQVSVLLFSAYFIFRHFSLGVTDALLLSFSLLFSSFVQWWNAYPTIGYPLLLLVAFLYWKKTVLLNQSVRRIIPLVFFVAFSLLIALNQLYPPYQIPLFLLLASISLGLIIKDQKQLTLRFFIYLIGSLIFSVGISAFVTIAYLKQYEPETQAIINSSYPGHRLSTGGTFPVFRLTSGFYDMQLLNDHKPMGPYNQSEAAGFINIFLFILPIIIVNESVSRIRKKQNNWVMVALVAYMLFIAGWMFVGYPPLLAKILLLDRVPANRADIGLGVAGLILTALYVYTYKLVIPRKWWKFVLAFLSFAVILLTGFYLRQNYPTYISNVYKIFLLSGFASGIVLAAICQWKKTFAISLLAFSLITAGSVHPIRRGLGPVTDSEFIKQVRELNERKPARWAVYNSNILSPLLYANGIQSATGVFLYPQVDWWLKFDPTSAYKDIWNRYAHVYFIEPANRDKGTIVFSLVNLDSFAVIIDPCNQLLDDLNILYLVAPTPLSSECVIPISNDNYNHEIYLYERYSSTAK